MEPTPRKPPQGDSACSQQTDLEGNCSFSAGVAEESQVLPTDESLTVGGNPSQIRQQEGASPLALSSGTSPLPRSLGASPLARSPAVKPQEVSVRVSLKSSREQVGQERDWTRTMPSVDSKCPLLPLHTEPQGVGSPMIAVELFTDPDGPLQANEMDSPIEEEEGLPELLSQPPLRA